MIKNNSNRIQQSGFGCLHCGKNYKRRTHLNKHQLLCETLVRAKNSDYINKQLILENETPTPTPTQMYNIILELSNKCNRLEEKVEQMQKWVDKKKKKINIMDWLSKNQMLPANDWNTFMESIEILKEETEMILHHSFLEVFNEIMNRILTVSAPLPLFAFIENQNHIYIYSINTKESNNNKEWSKANKEDISQFLNHIHFKFVKSFIEWKKKNETKINESDSLCELCNKANIKIMGIHFKEPTTYNKYRLCIYNKIKTDMKTIIEYEIEF